MGDRWKIIKKYLLRSLILIPVIWIIAIVTSYGQVYETNDISDYGVIKGNFSNEEPEEFIFSFFPAELDSSFSDITYHYKAKKGDGYAYECFLEFVIKDRTAYRDFIDSRTDKTKITPFPYHKDYMEYSVYNVFDINWTNPNDEGGYPIDKATVGKILFCDSSQRIIFFALGMWDGGGTDTTELNYFFDKFQIDVIDYQWNAYINYIDQENGLTCRDRYEQGITIPHGPPNP